MLLSPRGGSAHQSSTHESPISTLPQHMIPDGPASHSNGTAAPTPSSTCTSGNSRRSEDSSEHEMDTLTTDTDTSEINSHRHSQPSSVSSEVAPTVVTVGSSVSSPQTKRNTRQQAVNPVRPTRENVLRRLSEALMRRSLTLVRICVCASVIDDDAGIMILMLVLILVFLPFVVNLL
jgi:hypothetical protein